MSTVPMTDADRREILREYEQPLWRLTAGYARHRADREDLYQEILLAVWRALARFRGDCSVRTFVYRVAHNRSISHRARARRRETAPLDDVREPTHAARSPEALTIAQDRTERLHAAIRSLSLSFREPVLLRLEGLSGREIAEVIGITANNVHVRLHRARRQLRRLLSEEDEE